MNASYLFSMILCKTFCNLLDKILDIILYMLSTSDMGLYSSSPCGLSTLGIRVIKKVLQPLGHPPQLWKQFVPLTTFVLIMSQNCLKKLKLNPSSPGLFLLSHSQTTAFIYSIKNILTKDHYPFCLWLRKQHCLT